MLLQLLFCEQLHACHSGVGKKDCLPSYYVVEGRVGEEDGQDGQEEHALSVHAGQPMLSQNGFQGLGVHCSQHSKGGKYPLLRCRDYMHKLQRLYAGYSDGKANSAQF